MTPTSDSEADTDFSAHRQVADDHVKRSARRPAVQLREHAYDAIKRRIIDLTYRPGASLNEARISDDLGIGRTPVHMAIMRLAQEGLIEIIPRNGLTIAPLTFDDIQAVFEARLLNEPAAAKFAAIRATDADIALLTDIIRRGKAIGRNGARDELMQIDQEFHEAIADATKNKVLSDVLKSLHDRARRLFYISWNFDSGVKTDTMLEHGDIVDAIARRKPEHAEKLMRTHIQISSRVFGTLSRSLVTAG